MKKLSFLLAVLFIAIIFAACSNSDLNTNQNPSNTNAKEGIVANNTTTNANPAIVFLRSENLTSGKVSYTCNTIWVMNADGSNQTRIFQPSIISSKNSVTVVNSLDSPHWSPDGTQICFIDDTLKGSSWYDRLVRVDVSVKNEIPVASNFKIILNASSSNDCLLFSSWSPNSTSYEIAFSRFKSDQNPSYNWTIQVVSANGGTPTVLYTCPSSEYRSQEPCFNADGSQIIFKNYGTNIGQLILINRNDGSISNTLNFSPYSNALPFDWARGSGKTNFALELQRSNCHDSIYNYDVSTKQLTLLEPLATYATWSPDNSQIAFTAWEDDGQELLQNLGIKVLTISSGSVTTLTTGFDTESNWKK